MVRRLMRRGAMRRRGMGRLLVLVHMGVMMQRLPLVQVLQMDLPLSLRRKRGQRGWRQGWVAVVLHMMERVVGRQVSIHVLRVTGSLIKVLNGGRGGSGTPALSVSVIGEERTSVQSQADRMVGTPDQGGFERRECDVRTTGSPRVAQSQVLGSHFCPVVRVAEGTTKNEDENVRSESESDSRERYNQTDCRLLRHELAGDLLAAQNVLWTRTRTQGGRGERE